MKRITRKIAFHLESLESRRLLSALTVINAADSGVGSLRERIASAHSGDIINFAPGLAGQTIETGGGIAIAKSLTIQGLGANQLTIRGSGGPRIFNVSGSTSQVAIRDLTITGLAGLTGGAIDNSAALTLSGCTLSGNSSMFYYPYNWSGGPGGAIYNTGTLVVSNSTFSRNDAGDDRSGIYGAGGAIFNTGTLAVSGSNFSGNTAGHGYYADGGGGAIFNYYGTATISGCNLSGNTAYLGGGAISVVGGVVTVSNCTIANNLARGDTYPLYDDEFNVIGYVGTDARGGGLSVRGGTLSVDHSTLAGNVAIGGGGDPGYEGWGYGGGLFGGPTQLYDTIIADNYAYYGPDLYASVISLGHNLIGNAGELSDFVASDLLDVNPQLGLLQDNGGLSPTMSLLAGSPAINAGDNNNPTAYDQRGPGFPRILADTIDIGAFESGNSADYTGLTISDVTVTEGNSGSVTAALTVTLSEALSSAATVNFGTSDGTATVAGNDYLATSGSLTFSPGETSKTITVTVKGDRIAELNEQFVVNAIGASNSHVSSAQGTVTIIDDEPRVSINNASATEGNGGTTPMNFTVTLAAPYDVATSVNFSTASGSAIAGKDFDASSGTVTFLPEQTSKTLSVAVRGDVIDEYDETFTVSLSGASNGLILNAEGTGTIIDNDAPPAIVVGDFRRAEGNAGTTPFTFSISLLTPSEKSVSVGYATGNGTATSSTAGNKQDYMPGSNTVTLSPGQQSATATIAVIGDTRSENDETFFVNLSQPVNATIADAQGTGTILNDDGGRGKNWVGPTSGGSWGTAANWSPSGVPGTDSLVLIAGAAVTLSANASVSELTLGDGAALTVAAGGNRVLRTPALYFGSNSTLDLKDNGLIFDYADAASSPLQTICLAVQSGYAAGAWNGTGITSSTAASATGMGLGLGEASELFSTFPAPFCGQSVDATSTLVRYTLLGDANMDRAVDITDLGILATYWQGTGNFGQGDFNYDGHIDVSDLGLLATNWQATVPASSGSLQRARGELPLTRTGTALPVTAWDSIFSGKRINHQREFLTALEELAAP